MNALYSDLGENRTSNSVSSIEKDLQILDQYRIRHTISIVVSIRLSTRLTSLYWEFLDIMQSVIQGTTFKVNSIGKRSTKFSLEEKYKGALLLLTLVQKKSCKVLIQRKYQFQNWERDALQSFIVAYWKPRRWYGQNLRTIMIYMVKSCLVEQILRWFLYSTKHLELENDI